MVNTALITPAPDPLRRGEARERLRWGVWAATVLAVAFAVAEVSAPGVGLWVGAFAALLPTLAMTLMHGAVVRHRSALPPARAIVAALRTAARIAAIQAASLGALTTCAARRRIPTPPRLPAAGVHVAPRLLPRPIAARA